MAEGSCRAWVYFMTDRRDGMLYVGTTSDLARRVWEHRDSVVEGFTERYGLKRLVYAESHESIAAAIQREKNIKHWKPAWKVALIEKANPEWDDFFGALAGGV